MILEKYGQGINTKFGSFMIRQKIIGNSVSGKYEGLTGHITEIRTGNDRDTDNETEDIYVCFDPPEDSVLIQKVEAAFSESYQEPKTIEDIPLDLVIMAPEMLSVLPCDKKLRIYQMNPDRQNNEKINLIFTGLDFITAIFKEIPADIYDIVFDGDAGTECPEEIYRIFNATYPDGYKGRNLSVSDIIELYDETGSNFLYCDSFSFKLIALNSSLANKGTGGK
jgi:hypothetical protein